MLVDGAGHDLLEGHGGDRGGADGADQGLVTSGRSRAGAGRSQQLALLRINNGLYRVFSGAIA